MGLLDIANDPMMGLATGLLSAGGPSRMPVSLGQALGAGVQGIQEFQQNGLVNQMRQAQMGEMQRKQAALKQLREQIPEPMRPMFDMNPEGFLAQLNKEEEAYTLTPGAVRYKGERKIAEAPVERKAPEGMQWGVNGLEAIPGYVQMKSQIAAAGRPAITLPKIEVKMGESVASQVGPMMKDARVSADGAVKMFDAADRIEKAVDSGLVSAGPLTSLTMPVKQFFAGSTDNVRQTRQVIKSLAQMSVEARKQLAGQGQVTESEAAAVAKADAGDINDLTVGELKDLVTLTKRAAHFTAKSYNEQLRNLDANEGTKNLVPFYNVRGLDPLINHSPQLPQIGGQNRINDLLKKYGGS